MNLFHRVFTAKHPALRLGLAMLLFALLIGLGLVLPRGLKGFAPGLLPGATPAYAATEGYLLVYEFKGVTQESVQPVIDQLTAKVREFKAAHKLPEEQPQKMRLALVSSESSSTSVTTKGSSAEALPECENKAESRFVVAVALESTALLDELKEELKSIAGLPEPKIMDKTWFQTENLPIPSAEEQQINIQLGDKAHLFAFPKDASVAEMEQAIKDWLKANRPGMDFDVKLDKQVEGPDGNQVRITVRIEGKKNEPAEPSGAK